MRADRPLPLNRVSSWLLALLLVGMAPLQAADDAQKAGDSAATKAETPEPVPASSVTRHQIELDGKALKYTATVGWYILKDAEDKPIARFGYTAYTLDGVRDLARRPVTFAFNGGPGSSSIWLHMGIMGPRRAVVNDPGYAAPPPAQIVDNAYSPLDVTDVVMFDPVGTGFSKPLGDAKPEDFHGVDEDIRSVAQFIKRYVSENGRWGSPKYVLGESYGGMRGAGLAYHLQAEQGMNLNGLVVVSPFLNAETGIDGAGIDYAHVAYLPTLAATAWYHGLVQDKPASIAEYMADVERFAREEYLPALARGYVLPEAQKQAVAAKLARYTGTTPEYWERADLRVTHTQFLQELKRTDRLIAGRIDSRYIGPSVNPLAGEMDYDPFFPAIGPAYTSAFLSYLHGELQFGRDEEYRVSAFDIEWSWEHEQPGNAGWMSPIPNTVPDLALALTMNPGLHVLVQQGWYDLATPYLATKMDLEHLDVAPEARNRIHVKYYDAGHMMYVHGPSMQQFRDDLVGFIRETDRL
jgi:carboxypeptidase C (cathepsin A)